MPGSPSATRDPRIDLLRGLALATIYIDHVPDNPLNPVTMRNFGFADAAELFVILAGVSAMFAYGRAFERDGALLGLRRVGLRCLRLYVFQIGMLLTTLAFAHLWRQHFGLETAEFAPFLDQPFAAIGHALALHALPASLNILPLYIVLLAAFPLIYAGMSTAPRVTLLLSGLIWLGANLDRDFNLRNWLDGQGWYFNPFAWQFLFTLGAFTARVLRAHGGALPRHRLAAWLCWAYLVAALLLAAPWTGWGLPLPRLIDLDPPDKTVLAPARLLDILALIYLALSSGWLRRVAGSAWAAPLVACGRHSLEVFATATLAALMFRVLFHLFAPSWALLVLVNPVGLGAMLLLAWALEHNARARRATYAKPVEAGHVT